MRNMQLDDFVEIKLSITRDEFDQLNTIHQQSSDYEYIQSIAGYVTYLVHSHIKDNSRPSRLDLPLFNINNDGQFSVAHQWIETLQTFCKNVASRVGNIQSARLWMYRYGSTNNYALDINGERDEMTMTIQAIGVTDLSDPSLDEVYVRDSVDGFYIALHLLSSLGFDIRLNAQENECSMVFSSRQAQEKGDAHAG